MDNVQFRLPLGVRAEDTVTGFTGTITGRVDYLTGCHQYLLSRQVDSTGEIKTAWFDDARLTQRSTTPVQLPIPTNRANGADVAPPSK